jgi:hypothetical protein
MPPSVWGRGRGEAARPDEAARQGLWHPQEPPATRHPEPAYPGPAANPHPLDPALAVGAPDHYAPDDGAAPRAPPSRPDQPAVPPRGGDAYAALGLLGHAADSARGEDVSPSPPAVADPAEFRRLSPAEIRRSSPAEIRRPSPAEIHRASPAADLNGSVLGVADAGPPQLVGPAANAPNPAHLAPRPHPAHPHPTDASGHPALPAGAGDVRDGVLAEPWQGSGAWEPRIVPTAPPGQNWAGARADAGDANPAGDARQAGGVGQADGPGPHGKAEEQRSAQSAAPAYPPAALQQAEARAEGVRSHEAAGQARLGVEPAEAHLAAAQRESATRLVVGGEWGGGGGGGLAGGGSAGSGDEGGAGDAWGEQSRIALEDLYWKRLVAHTHTHKHALVRPRARANAHTQASTCARHAQARTCTGTRARPFRARARTPTPLCPPLSSPCR